MVFWRREKPAEKPIEINQVEKPKTDEYVSPFAKGKEEIEAAVAAMKAYREKASAAFNAFETDQPAFKIIRMPEGHYEIYRMIPRMAFRADRHYQTPLMCYTYKAEEIEKWSHEPYVTYEAVKNYKAPIVTQGYGRYRSPTTSYAAQIFNTLEEAEAYLFRMVKPEDETTEYDFPPLKKRAKRAKKATGQ